jgi:pilus assembly protein CpaE
MYPLTALLIGCSDSVLGDLRRELATLAVGVDREFFDVRSCLAHVLAQPQGKWLFVVFLSQPAEIAQLERLNESLAGQPILALVDPASDPSMMVRAMRAGAAQVVRVPLVADDFRAAMQRIAIQFGHPASQSRVITVIGASEGSGATTISLNLAAEIGRLRNEPCILGEGAVFFSRLAPYLNIHPQITSADLMADLEHLDLDRVRRALVKVDDHLQVVTGSHAGISPLELTSEGVFKLLGYARQLANFIVVDARYTYEDLDFEFMVRSQQLVLVAKPTVPSLYNLGTLLEALSARDCLAQQFVVINQFVETTGPFSRRHLAEILPQPKAFMVHADLPAVRAAENAGQTLRKAAPRSRAAADIEQLARAILGMPEEPRHAAWSWLAPWTRAAQTADNAK